MALQLKLHDDCFKVKDPRIANILQGNMSVELFAASITANDPFVLIHDTIYVMTEQEYYATRPIYPIHNQIDHMFNYVMRMEDLSRFSEKDQALIKHVKKEYPTCPSCRMKRFRREIYALALRNGIESELQDCLVSVNNLPKYPEVTGEIKPNVTALLPDLHNVPDIKRKGCIACVEKHLSQAYILANEALMGYPEHIILMCGHLNEAISELPDEAFGMKQTLEFCAAKTIETGVPLMPLWAILAQIRFVQRWQKDKNADQLDDAMTELGLDYTDEMRQELAALTPKVRTDTARKLLSIFAIADTFAKFHTEELRFQFSGELANLAERLAQMAPKFVNMLRDRRITFVAAPDLMVEASYDFKDVVKDLLGSGVDGIDNDVVVDDSTCTRIGELV